MSRHSLQNPELANYTFLQDLYNDNTFPFEFTQRGEEILANTCRQIEANPPSDVESLYLITQAATERFNNLRDEFDIEGGDTLRDALANDLAYIAQCYGIYDTDTERLTATQDNW
ncbi:MULTISPECIES: DUF5713 family protein [Eikenella]|uniref:Uncharacterized protein n=1 Tax=Eikenella longinqua TaxID=1795827 RepID=A0A1A9RZ73_9NEIS|nr:MULTISPECIES: DUF5713 family protein [Eikenella]OAM29186.1 hypothetical protein A7P95_04370 [Eikenella longinqua]